ncbi:MAG: peptidase M28 [Planctomycetota bacterium]|nr:MAG: peptidase M28 [Planctomycetota bacterium]
MWEQIRRNRRRSALVVAAMGVLLVATGAALGGLAAQNEAGFLLGAAVAGVLWLIQWGITASQGDRILLRVAGAKEVRKADHPQLHNVVEEMSIAASLDQKPRVCLVDDPAPNAFAVGRNPRDAAVAVTTGLLRRLDRDELQGVIAHEIGHIKNRDVALMTTAGIMLGVIVLLSEIGARSLRFGGVRHSRSSRKGGGGAIVLVLVVVLIILAPLLAQLIYFALSRRREYLADASAARFTRYPEGLARALEKIDASGVPLADTSKVTAPMYIAPPAASRRRAVASWFSTHPPLSERIRILRGMAGGAGYDAYQSAYQEARGGTLMGARTVSEARDLPARAALAEAGAVPAAERARAASDAFLAASGYARRPCPSCTALLKLPPSLQERVLNCPRCGQPLPRAD